MALRSPIYLDSETLIAQAEYHQVEVPHQADVVEKTTRQRSAGGRVGSSSLGAAAKLGRNVEYQTSYTLTPTVKATVSQIIDSLMLDDRLKTEIDDETALSKDDLVELDGTARITAASLAGKMFHIVRRLLEASDQNLEELGDLDVSDPAVAAELKRVYLQNELLPIPILLEMIGTGVPQSVYVSVRPSHFVDAASADRLEGELRVLGVISGLVPGGPDGYLSAERWLLDGYEYLFRRKLMLEVGTVVKELVDQFELDLPSNDVHAYIAGPAIVVDAIAIY